MQSAPPRATGSAFVTSPGRLRAAAVAAAPLTTFREPAYIC